MDGNHRFEGGPGLEPKLRRLGDVLYGADRELIEWVSRAVPGYLATEGAKALGVIKGGKIAAAVIYERFNGVNCEVTIHVQDKRWADRRSLFALFEFPFLQQGCIVITATVPMSNLQSLNLCSKLGFEPVAIVRFAAPDGSALVVMQQHREKCRWLYHGQGRQRTGSTGPLQDGER